MTPKLFCFGYGYSAQILARQLRQSGENWPVAGTSRTADPAQGLYAFSNDHPLENPEEILRDVTHLLISIAPQEDIGDPVLHHHRDILTRLPHVQWVGYLSTTGVYGDRQGAWVNDNTPPAPTATRGHLRLKAEQDWRALCQEYDLPVHIFRLGSIYGPPVGRSPGRGQLTSLMSDKARKIVKPGQFFSRIHVEDIARVLRASMARPHPGQTYNVVDDLPAPSPEVLDYVCDLLGKPPLPAVDITDATLSPMMRMFYSENKRVRNDRIKQDLGVTLQYPTYREGFKALVGD
ncbi:SDR family oxidoreductase [Paremcibacter congregatus]|uniref:SDR family oxidoreductase n=1 Tax=Paremcibacter congregatus TaxID=2043170 RepID=UPI0030EF3EF8